MTQERRRVYPDFGGVGETSLPRSGTAAAPKTGAMSRRRLRTSPRPFSLLLACACPLAKLRWKWEAAQHLI